MDKGEGGLPRPHTGLQTPVNGADVTKAPCTAASDGVTVQGRIIPGHKIDDASPRYVRYAESVQLRPQAPVIPHRQFLDPWASPKL